MSLSLFFLRSLGALGATPTPRAHQPRNEVVDFRKQVCQGQREGTAPAPDGSKLTP